MEKTLDFEQFTGFSAIRAKNKSVILEDFVLLVLSGVVGGDAICWEKVTNKLELLVLLMMETKNGMDSIMNDIVVSFIENVRDAVRGSEEDDEIDPVGIFYEVLTDKAKEILWNASEISGSCNCYEIFIVKYGFDKTRVYLNTETESLIRIKEAYKAIKKPEESRFVEYVLSLAGVNIEEVKV